MSRRKADLRLSSSPPSCFPSPDPDHQVKQNCILIQEDEEGKDKRNPDANDEKHRQGEEDEQDEAEEEDEDGVISKFPPPPPPPPSSTGEPILLEAHCHPSEEDAILASSDATLVKHYQGLLPNVVVQSHPSETELILPSLGSVLPSEDGNPTAVVVASKEEPPCPVEVPISFTPRNSSSPKGHDEEVESLILEAAPLVHHISSDTNGEDELPLASREFTYILDAPTACKFRKNEDPLTYINKDLFYGLSLEFRRCPESNLRHGSTVTSIILMDFREQKSREEALKTWSFWHSRQHSEEVRILDVEYNVVSGIVGHPTELAYNAVSVQWSPDLGNAYIMIAVRCLSTDFSIQKGIKGIPLQLQIDTSDEFGTLISRAVCQVKVFCDKGAERKTREDLKRFVREIEKNSGPMEYCREGEPRSVFKPSADLSSKPVLFNPLTSYQRLISGGSVSVGGSTARGAANSEELTPSETVPPKRRCVRYREGGSDPSRIMIYVRQDSEDIFTALHVHPPSVFGLIQAISAKYQIDFSNIRYLYRRDLRGIVVKVDDDMLKYYCDEDAFLMKVLAYEEKNTQSMVHDIVLVDLPDSRRGEPLEKDSNNNNDPENNNNA